MADERVVCDAAQEKTARSGDATVLTRTCDAFSTREGEALVVLVAVAFDGTTDGVELDVRLKREDAAAAKGIDAFLGGVTLMGTRAGADGNKAGPAPKPVKLPAWKDMPKTDAQFGLSLTGFARWRYSLGPDGTGTLESWFLADAKPWQVVTIPDTGPAHIAASADGSHFIVGGASRVHFVNAFPGGRARTHVASFTPDRTRRGAAFVPGRGAVLVGWGFDGASAANITWLDVLGELSHASPLPLDGEVLNVIPHPDRSVIIRTRKQLIRASRDEVPTVIPLRDRRAEKAVASDFLVRDTDGKRSLMVFRQGESVFLVDPDTGESVRNGPRGTFVSGTVKSMLAVVADRVIIYRPGDNNAEGQYVVWDPTQKTEQITLRAGLGAARNAWWRPVGDALDAASVDHTDANLRLRFIEETGDGRFRQQPRMVDVDLSQGIPAALAAPCCPWTPPSRQASDAGTPIAIAPLAPRPGKPRGGGNKTPGAPVPTEGVATIKARMEADGWTLTTSKTASFAKTITLRAPVPPKEMNVCAQASRPMLLTVKIAAGGNTGQSTIPDGRGCSSAFVKSQGGAQTIDITVDTTSSGGASESATVLVFSR